MFVGLAVALGGRESTDLGQSGDLNMVGGGVRVGLLKHLRCLQPERAHA